MNTPSHLADASNPFRVRAFWPVLLLLCLIAGTGVFAQSQGTYLLVDFSTGEGAGQLDSLTVARLEPMDGANVTALPSNPFEIADATASQTATAEDTGKSAGSTGAFSESAFSLPSESDTQDDAKLFDEDAFLNPSFGGQTNDSSGNGFSL